MAGCNWKPPKDAFIEEEYLGCPYNCYEGLQFCVFHAPLDAKRKSPELVRYFKVLFDSFFNNGILKDEAGSFEGFVFPDDIDLSELDFRRSYERTDHLDDNTISYKPVDFRWSEFGNNVIFTSALFGNAVVLSNVTFGDSACFDEAIFGDSVDFNSSSFGVSAQFVATKFGKSTSFWDTKFGNHASFIDASFGNFTSFLSTIFDNKARFSRAYFGSNVLFEKVHFNGSTSFRNANFGEDTTFRKVVFLSTVYFRGIRGQKKALYGRGWSGPQKPKAKQLLFSGELFHTTPPKLVFWEVVFKGFAHFQDLDLSRVRFQQVDLGNLSFLNSQISETKFISWNWGTGPESSRYARWDLSRPWSLCRPRLLLDELIYRDRQIEKKERSKKKRTDGVQALKAWRVACGLFIRNPGTYDPKIRQVRKEPHILLAELDVQPSDIEVLALQLKQSLEATKDPIAAGDFHFAAMEMKRVQAMEAKRWGRAFMLWLYKTVNGYGERYGRTGLWLFFLLLISSGVFANFEVAGIIDGASYWKRLDPAAFYSLQHVLPFKLGTSVGVVHKANSLLGWLTVIETIIGTTLFTFFALALRRRFKR